MKTYYRPIAQLDAVRPADALPLAGGWSWFNQVERLTRQGSDGLIGVAECPAEVLAQLTAKRLDIAGVTMDQPRLMGILNVTPDSFSDGGQFLDAGLGAAQGAQMVEDGADILDVGGESTRPGADTVPVAEEIARTRPVIAAVADKLNAPISIDTRKAAVGREALDAGAQILNDVSALSFDAEMAVLAAQSGAPICLMHASGDPKTMQDKLNYDNVVLDVYDYLEQQVLAAQEAGIKGSKIIVDPGIGFGKTAEQNLNLLRNLSLLHGLGCPILLGASRKRFIGTIGRASNAQDRTAGSISVALGAISQGVQIVRTHDIVETRQALRLWQAVTSEW